jgi:hypothetical protein
MKMSETKIKNTIVLLYVTFDIYVLVNSKLMNLFLDLKGTIKSRSS